MCEHCHMEHCCLYGHRMRRGYGPQFEQHAAPDPRSARESLEEERAFLERRLKNLEARLAETTK